MTFEVRSEIPGLSPEANRALVEVQTTIARECKRLEERASRPRRRVTELVEEGAVIAKPGEVVRVQPGDEDVTVVLPEPSPASDGEDIIISFEGDGTATGRVLVQPANGTCAVPGTQILNAPGSYRFTSTGGGATPKPRSNAVPVDPSVPSGGVWGGPPPLTAEDLPEDSVDNDVLADMPGNSVKVNATGASGSPTDLVVGADSVVGRLGGTLGSVALADIDSASIPYDSASHTFQRAALSGAIAATQNSNATRFAGIRWNNGFTNAVGFLNFIDSTSNVVAMADDPGNDETEISLQRAALSGAISAPQNSNTTRFAGIRWNGGFTNAVGFLNFIDSTSNVVVMADDPGNDETEISLQRAALTGFVSAAQNSNATTSAEPIVTFSASSNMSNERVLSNGTGTTVDIGTAGQIQIDIDTPLTDGDKGSITVSSNGTVFEIDADVVTNTELANMAAGTYKGRLVTASSGDPTDLTGNEAAAGLRYDTIVDVTTTGTITSYSPTGFTAATVGIRISPPGNVVLRGMPLATNQQIVIRVGRGAAFTVTLNHEDTSASADSERFNTPNNVALVLRAGEAAIIRNTESRNNVVAAGRTSVADADYGDITVTNNGATWTIDNDVVSDAKLRNSVGLSVIGRSSSATGDPGDISTSTSSNAVLRESSGVLGFGTISLAAFPSIADDTFLANISGSSAQPTAVALTTLAGAGLTGGADAVLAVGAGTRITVNANDVQLAAGAAESFLGNFTSGSAVADYRAGSSVAGAGLTYTAGGTLAVGAGTRITVNADDVQLAAGAAESFLGNFTAGSAVADYRAGSSVAGAGLTYTAGGTLAVGAGTYITVNADDVTINRTTLAADLDSTSIIANSGTLERAALTGDVTASQNSNATTIADDAVTNAKLANMAQSTIKGRAEGAGTGDPTDLSATQVAAIIDGEAITWTNTQTFSGAVVWSDDHVESGALPYNITIGDTVNKLFINTAGDGEIQTIGGTTTAGRIVRVYILASGLKTIVHGTGAGSMQMPGSRNHVLGQGQSFTLIGNNPGSGWRVSDVPLEVGVDKGDISINSTGATWTIDNDAVSDAKLRNSAALSVIGRSANSTGDPADIAAGTDGHVLRRSGTTLGFGTVANAGLRDSAALSVIGRSANSTGAVADIAAANDGEVLRRSGTTLGFGTIATAGIADAAVTLAKQADLAQSRIIGRAEGAGTGVPTALTPTQVMSIVDGEDVTWAGAHTFNGTNVYAGSNTFNGPVRIDNHLRLESDISETLGAATNNWNPSGLSSSTVVRVTLTNIVQLSGLVPPANGAVVVLARIDTDTDNLFSLLHQSGSSSAANRFILPGESEMFISVGCTVTLWYDGTSSRWRVIGRGMT